jgi:hypothetical protein
MTHTGEQLALLKKYGLRLNPDLVLVGFFAGNDFVDADPYRKRIVVNDTYFDIDTRHEMKFLGYPIVPKSRLWYFIRQRIIAWKNVEKVQAWDAAQTQDEDSSDSERSSSQGTFVESAFLEIERHRLSICQVPSYEKGIYSKNIEYILQSFSQMKELLDDHGIQLAVGIYPDEFQVDDALLDKIFQTYDLDRALFDTTLIQRVLEDHLRAANIDFVDLLGEFRAKGKDKRLYLLRNTHWNKDGIALAADLLFQFLVPKTDAALKPAMVQSPSLQDQPD